MSAITIVLLVYAVGATALAIWFYRQWCREYADCRAWDQDHKAQRETIGQLTCDKAELHAALEAVRSQRDEARAMIAGIAKELPTYAIDAELARRETAAL